MKTLEVLQILREIKMGTSPSDTEQSYIQYLQLSLEAITNNLNIDTTPHREKYIQKALTIFRDYYTVSVTYPPEMEIIVPYAFGTKLPLIPWKQPLSEKKRKALRNICQRAGPVITCGFRLNRKIIMIDIDFEIDKKKRDRYIQSFLKAYEVAIRHRLPVKPTHGGGLHIYIPADPATYPDGLVLKIVDNEGRTRTYLNTTPKRGILHNEDTYIEIKIDAVTHHYLQSWLWHELYYGEEKTPRDVKFRRLPSIYVKIGEEVTEYPITMKWFLWGETLTRRDVEDLFKQILEELAESLNLEKTCQKIELEPATPELIHQAKTAPDTDTPFRALTATAVPPLLLDYEPEWIYLFHNTTLHDLLQILKKLDKHEALPHCIKLFTLDPDMEHDVVKHYIFIVAWFLLQNMKKWVFNLRETTGDGIELATHVAELHGLKPRIYYYLYYSNALEIEPNIFETPRPILAPIKQLAEAHQALTTEETKLCTTCPYSNICRSRHTRHESARRRLTRVIDTLALEIVHNPALHTLIGFLHAVTLERAIRGKAPVLPTLTPSNITARKLGATPTT